MTLKELEKKIHEIDDEALMHLHAIIYADAYDDPEYLAADDVCLDGLMYWGETPQGHDYWSNINRKLGSEGV